MIGRAIEPVARPFVLTSREGLPIRGLLTLPPQPTALVVTVHGFKGFKDWSFFPWTSSCFADAQIASCRFDMSRCGVTGDGDTFERLDLFADDTYTTELADLGSVLDYLDRQDEVRRLPRFLFGHSRGGAIALLAASSAQPLHGVVTWSAISELDRWDTATRQEWRRRGFMEIVNQRTKQLMRVSTRLLDDLEQHRERLDLRGAVSTLDAPLLVVHGTADETVPSHEGEAIAALARNGSLVLIDGATHTFGAIHPLVHVPRGLDLAMAVTVRFVRTWAGAANRVIDLDTAG